MLFEIFSGRGKTRKSSLCLPYPNSPSVCALFRCEVNAENISFFYCMESTCWDGHIFIEVSGWLLVSKLCLCGLHPAEVVQLPWSTQAQLLHGLWGHCPLPLGPPVMGRWKVLGCFILFSPRSNQRIWIRTETFLRSLLGPADLDLSQTHHASSQEPWNGLRPPRDYRCSGRSPQTVVALTQLNQKPV